MDTHTQGEHMTTDFARDDGEPLTLAVIDVDAPQFEEIDPSKVSEINSVEDVKKRFAALVQNWQKGRPFDFVELAELAAIGIAKGL